MKTVIVACNNGVATSQTIASKVQSLLDQRNVTAKVEAVDIKSVETHLKYAAAYIYIMAPDKDYGLPLINGIAFLTGMNQEAELEKLIAVLS